MESLKVVYLSSGGETTPALRDCIRIYLDGKVGPGGTVQIVEFNDANPHKHPWREQPIYTTVKRIVKEDLGCKPHATHYELFNLRGLAPERLDDLVLKLQAPGTICIVVGGNTWRLASAFEPLPGIRNFIYKGVTKGELMYVSFSAGTILAGPSVLLAQDSQEGLEDRISPYGLGLVPFAMRPHAQTRGSKEIAKQFLEKVAAGEVKGRSGKSLKCKVKYVEDGQAIVVLGDTPYHLPDAEDYVRSYRPVLPVALELEPSKEAKRRQEADLYNASYDKWATKNTNKTKEHRVTVPEGCTLMGLVVYEQSNYGIIDIALVDSRNRQHRATKLPHSTITHEFMFPAGVTIQGLKVHEQGGYGVVDLQWLLPGGSETEPATTLMNNAHRSISLWKPKGTRINGMVVREQSCFGVIDIRLLVEPLPVRG